MNAGPMALHTALPFLCGVTVNSPETTRFFCFHATIHVASGIGAVELREDAPYFGREAKPSQDLGPAMPGQPKPNLTSADILLYSTYRIEGIKSGQIINTGTGFLFEFRSDHGQIPMLVTNRHVLEKCDSIRVRLHLGVNDAPSGNSAHVTINGVYGPASLTTCHPDADIDLCATPIGSSLKVMRDQGMTPFYAALPREMLPSGEDWEMFDSIEEVEMIGCPRGLYDAVSNLPITRRGITATPLGRRFEGKAEFMVDMACFPGSSGSPVFIRDTFGHFDRTTNTQLIGERRLKLVGILYAGPVIQNDGTIVLGGTPSVQVSTTMHLGQVIRSSELLALETAFLERVAAVTAHS